MENNITSSFSDYDKYILKIWKAHIVSKDIGQVEGTGGCLIKNADNSLYHNKPGDTVSISNEVHVSLGKDAALPANLTNKEAHEATKHLKDVLNQVKNWNDTHDTPEMQALKITNHIIAFPYYITSTNGQHYILGTLRLKFNEKNDINGSLKIYNSSEFGNHKVCLGVETAIKDAMTNIFSEVKPESVVLENIATLPFRQQKTGSTYCEAITAENGKKIIDGNYDRDSGIIAPEDRKLYENSEGEKLEIAQAELISKYREHFDNYTSASLLGTDLDMAS